MSAPAGSDFVLRPPVPGDFGWIIHRQATLYTAEYGWDGSFEILIAGLIAKFDPLREQAWIAERNGRIAGSIFLMRGDEPETAKLRLLYVEPDARGCGIGQALVDVCVERARAMGYRRVTLWTNDVLTAARKIYERSGFLRIAAEPHHAFGHDLVSETWLRDLD